MCEYLSRNTDQWRRVDQCVCQTGHQIGSAWSGRCKYDPRLCCNTGISLCCVNCTLLMSHKNVREPISEVIQRIIDRHDGTARVSEYFIYLFFDKASEQNF